VASDKGNTTHKGPEKKIGPYPGGIGVAVWMNNVKTEDGGTRKMRSVTISPRRYFDRQADEWKDSSSFWPGDLPALIYALQRALEFVSTTPIPGQPKEEEDHGDRPAF
jgi:hypothetical protein